MNKSFRLAAVLVIALLFAGYMISRSPATPASAASWTIVCTGVTGSERNLWFDTAGPGTNDEGGFFYFINNSIGDENCTAYTAINPAVSTNTYPKLRVRAAVNDSARFTIQVFKLDPLGEFCDSLVTTVSWNDTEDHSGFLTKEVTLPASTSICEIRVKLDDYPNSTSSARTNALIGDIRIWNGSTIGWRETFTAAP
jgi:hypothetical protein